MQPHSPLIGVGLWFALMLSAAATADEIRVAVASNFGPAMQAIATDFEAETGHRVILSSGSTGKHYAQIRSGAPFDAFFAADERRPELLEQAGLGVAGSRFTYARGRLVLWSPRASYVDTAGEALRRGFRHLAIANPRLAPYGRAAQQVLQALGLWETVAARLVRGQNLGQTFQFVASGNAELGFIAYAQIRQADGTLSGSHWDVPQGLYAPITQQALLLRDAAAGRALLAYVRSEPARAIIADYGYTPP